MNLKPFIQNRMVFLTIIILLTFWGAITQYLAYIDFEQLRISNGDFLQKITITLIVGWAFFVLIQFIKIPTILKQKWIWIGTALLLAVITPLIGYQVNGLYNFITIGSFSIHSGYAILLFYILFLASRRNNPNAENTVQSFKFSNIIEILATLSILFLMLLYMDKQLFFILTAMIIVNFFLYGFKKTGYILSALVIASFVLLIFSNKHTVNKISDYYTHQGNSHQVQQCLNSFDYGGLLGIGFERTQRSLEKGNLLPESLSHTSFAVVIEHFGILGGIILIALFAFIVNRGLWVYRNSKESDSSNLIALLLLAFLILNSAHILNCLNVFPFGSYLSFFSLGRDNFIINMILLGLIWKKINWLKL